MKFPKDILIIDFEGFKAPKQIGAVLLDQDTLQEKDGFVSYIYADTEGKKSAISGITQEMLDGAPTQAEVGKMLYEKFGTNIILASFVADFDIQHLKTILGASGLNFSEYDYHFLDIWSLAYTHLLKQGYTGSMRSEDIFQAFGAAPREQHDALEDCRITADVLRKIVHGA